MRKESEVENMKLKKYIDMLEREDLLRETSSCGKCVEQEVEYLSFDSKDMRENGLFVCKGAHFKPEYLQEALNRGAFCYLAEQAVPIEGSVPFVLVTDIRKAMALLANAYYKEAWRELKTIGITGTKGKSTTTYYVRSILDSYLESQGKPKSAVISGIDVYDGVICEESHLTTPEAIALHRHFRNAVDSGISYVEMEVSSQALRYYRTLGIQYDVGCFLNIGTDHISPIEHKDFDDYFDAKLTLMKQCRTACVNLNADHCQEVCDTAREHADLSTFGTDERADYYAHHIVKTERGIAFSVRMAAKNRKPERNENFTLSMPGLFNVDNALAAISICDALDVPVQYMKEGLEKAAVPGRMEVFRGGAGSPTVIVDYAHNRMSFEKLFTSAIREYPDKKIISIYGCPGKKAQARRKELAEIAGRYAAVVYVTEEDAGEEPVESICREIAANLRGLPCRCEIITDRGEAIRKAIEESGEDTLILVTGKGRETRQKRGVEYIDCPSDVEYVERYLK